MQLSLYVAVSINLPDFYFHMMQLSVWLKALHRAIKQNPPLQLPASLQIPRPEKPASASQHKRKEQ